MAEPSSVWLISHQLQGQICGDTSAEGSKACGQPATRISFGVKFVEGKPTENTLAAFTCDEHTSEAERCSTCPHSSDRERWAQLMRAVLDIDVPGVWPTFDVVNHSIELSFIDPRTKEVHSGN